MIRNIIFDWSGTLVDDLPAVWQATNHVFSRAGIPELSLAQFRAEFCLPFTRFYDRHIPHVPMAQLEEWFHGRLRQVQASVVCLPHAREFLDFCRSRGTRMFLLSSVHEMHYAAQVAAAGLNGYLERPYVGVLDKREKIHEILLENRLVSEETIFIGDMQHDVDTARHGGIASCAVLTGYNSVEQLRQSGPDLIVEHLGELRQILDRNGMRLRPGGSATALGDYPIATVGALIFDGRGRVLMIRTHKWSNLWGIPGGKIKSGEGAEAALRREILEETSLRIDEIRFVLVQDCIDSPEFYRPAHFVLLNYTACCVGPPDVRLNEEAQEYRWVTPEEAFRLPLNSPTRILMDAVRARDWGEVPA